MYYKKQTFTLSEVLILLVIIGFIAAITVPVMYNTYLKQETISKLKKRTRNRRKLSEYRNLFTEAQTHGTLH